MSRPSRGHPELIGDREVRVHTVGRDAPLDAAEHPAPPRAILPDDGAFTIGIERVADAGLLADNEQFPTVRQPRDGGPGAEVVVAITDSADRPFNTSGAGARESAAPS